MLYFLGVQPGDIITVQSENRVPRLLVVAEGFLLTEIENGKRYKVISVSDTSLEVEELSETEEPS